jgi:hypothetical protein
MKITSCDYLKISEPISKDFHTIGLSGLTETVEVITFLAGGVKLANCISRASDCSLEVLGNNPQL